LKKIWKVFFVGHAAMPFYASEKNKGSIV